MANFLRRNVLAAVSLVAALALSGCYTEVGSVRGERDEDYAYHPEDRGVVPDTTIEESGNYTDNDYDRDRSRFYFDYYYPSFTFGWGYYSWWRPWWSWGSWYYDPFYYSGGYNTPWGWGGYPGYVPGWWYPHYDGRYAFSSGYYGKSRTFGNSRTVGMNRGAYNPPSGGIMYGGARSSSRTGSRTGVTSGRSQTGSSSARPSTRVSPGRRSQSSNRYVAPSDLGRINRGNRGEARREYTQPRSAPAPRGEGRSGGNRSSGGGGRSYSPPASTGSSHSSPAPSGGGSRGGSSGGGGRQGGSRR